MTAEINSQEMERGLQYVVLQNSQPLGTMETVTSKNLNSMHGFFQLPPDTYLQGYMYYF